MLDGVLRVEPHFLQIAEHGVALSKKFEMKLFLPRQSMLQNAAHKCLMTKGVLLTAAVTNERLTAHKLLPSNDSALARRQRLSRQNVRIEKKKKKQLPKGAESTPPHPLRS